MKVDAEKQAQVNDAMVAETLAAYGLTPAKWEQVEEGIGNVVVLATDAKTGGEYYIKFYKTVRTHEAVEREVAFTNALADYGVPVLRYAARTAGGFVYAVPHPSGANYITVTHKTDGEHPARYTPGLIRVLARQHARLHLIGATYHDGRIFKPREYYHFVPAAPADTALQELEAAMEPVMERVDEAWPALPSGLAHLDIHRGNLLTVDDTLTGIIDFDDLSLAPLAFCLAGTLWNIIEAGGSERDVQDYLQYYEKDRPLESAEHAILPDMILMRGWIALHGLFFYHGRAARESARVLALLAQSCKTGLAGTVSGKVSARR